MTSLVRYLLHIASGAAVFVLTSFILASSIFAGRGQYEIPVLMYHHILHEAENSSFQNDSVITPERFEEQMQYLYSQGYQTITPNEMYEFLHNERELTGKRVMITFDDGYLSNYRYAYDILERYNFSATIFVITSKLNGQPEPFDPDKLTMLSIQEMQASGAVFNFGSHTHNMHRCDENGVPFLLCKADSEILEDTRTSFSFPSVEKVFAYPYGEFGRNTVEMLKGLDCGLAFTNRRGYATRHTEPYMIPRFPIHGKMPLDVFKGIISGARN